MESIQAVGLLRLWSRVLLNDLTQEFYDFYNGVFDQILHKDRLKVILKNSVRLLFFLHFLSCNSQEILG